MRTKTKYMQWMCATALAIGAAAFTLLPASAQAQGNPGTNIWHDDFDSFPMGADSAGDNGGYGAVAFNFSGAGYGAPFCMITNNNPDNLTGDPSYTHTQNLAIIFDPNPTDYPNPLNFGVRMGRPALLTTVTNPLATAYFLNFDVAVTGASSVASIGGYLIPSVGVYANNGGEYNGQGAQSNVPAALFPAPGTGYVHYSLPLASFGTAGGGVLKFTNDTAFSMFVAFVAYGHPGATTIEVDLANVSITQSNPPPPPAPVLHVVKADKPGLRVFAANHAFTYNQEGFDTRDLNQGWVGLATPSAPVTYAVKIADFDTVNGYTLSLQFDPNGNSGDPYSSYNGLHSLQWNIVANNAGFTSSVQWKTNAPSSGTPNTAATLTSGSLNGRGVWTLQFTDDSDGTITAPDGSTAAVTLPNDSTWLADFTDPVVLKFGTAPNNPTGYGQWITYGGIFITNVLDGNIVDDFTQDTNFDTTTFNPGFSLDANSCVLVPKGSPSYWVNWNIPDDNYQLEEKASLNSGTNLWFSPAYYGQNIAVSNSIPALMGTTYKWTLVPGTVLPTVSGVPGTAISTKQSFFRLANPGPSQ